MTTPGDEPDAVEETGRTPGSSSDAGPGAAVVPQVSPPVSPPVSVRRRRQDLEQRQTSAFPSPHRAAFFDVDKTLLPGSSLYLLARGMYRRGMYTSRDLFGFFVSQLAFRVSGMESIRGIEAARESALAFIEGKRQEEIEPLAQDIVVEVIGPRIYPGMRKVIEAHHANGDRTYLVTAAPAGIAERIAAHLGMYGALGTQVELSDGVYTGRLLGPVLHGPAKREAVLELAAAEEIDLSLSSAYSDSMNDRPLLESVGHPVAVNPDRLLRRLAVERAWPVQDFRGARRWLLVWGPSLAAVLAAMEGARRVRRWRSSSRNRA